MFQCAKVVVQPECVNLKNFRSDNWRLIASNHIVNAYVDESTIKCDRSRTGNLVTMLELLDFHTMQIDLDSVSYESSRMHCLYDCKNKQVRILETIVYGGMVEVGKGVKIVWEDSEWELIKPGSIGEALWEVAWVKNYETWKFSTNFLKN